MHTPTTGLELRERREEADVLAIDLAKAMEVHPSRISQIEALAQVTRRTERRYLEALSRVTVATTSEVAPAETA